MTLPPELEKATRGYKPHLVTIGESRATVSRWSAPGRCDLFLKSQRREPLFDLQGEAARLRWLQGRAPVPAVIDFVTDETHDHLLMEALPGEDAASTTLEPERRVTVLAESLRELHAIDIEDCPFRVTTDDLIQRAAALLAAGEVDEGNFDPENLGRPAAEVFAEMLAGRPTAAGRVFTHGDYCLPNVMIHAGRLSGFIDLGTAGIGDPYRDLALVSRSLSSNLGPAWRAVFFERYGLIEPEAERLRYYRLLDEFF